MKAGFHFDSNHAQAGIAYGTNFRRALFARLLGQRTLNISSKVFVGDLLFSRLDNSRVGSKHGALDQRPFDEVAEAWLNPDNPVWARMALPNLSAAFLEGLYVISFETIEGSLAQTLHLALEQHPAYVGIMEVDDASFTHWQLYTKRMVPRFRIVNRDAYVFWEGMSESPKDEGLAGELQDIGFSRVAHEATAGRYSIFDRHYNYDQARRVAEWKQKCGALLAFAAEDVVHRLEDAAPDLANRLWSALKAFEEAETNATLSQAMSTCRGLVEYVADRLFPPTDEIVDGHKLGPKQFRNRLLAFAERERRSDTDVDLICVSGQNLDEQMRKLADLANKGVHDEVYRAEARRCLVRTILLLDDILSLKAGPLGMRPDLDFRDFVPPRD